MRSVNKKTLVFADAFSGCGGLSLGLLQAGLRGRFAIENDKFAFATFSANLLSKNAEFRFEWPRWLPKEPISVAELLRDYEDRLKSLTGTIDVLVGGPPCQGFSSAGRRKHDDPRNELFNSYLRFVDILRPTVVLLENVRGFTADFDVNSSVKNYSQQLRKKLAAKYNVFGASGFIAIWGTATSYTILRACDPARPLRGKPIRHPEEPYTVIPSLHALESAGIILGRDFRLRDW
jgi:DNA (cytosine-5)-methyltransferase 1